MRITVGKETDEWRAERHDYGRGKVLSCVEYTEADGESEEKFRQNIFHVPPTRRTVCQKDQQMKWITDHRLTLA